MYKSVGKLCCSDTMTWRAAPPRGRERGAQRLEHVDRGAIGDDELAGARANQPRDLVAHALRQVHPPRRIPASDQSASPLVAGDLAQPSGRGPGKCAQGIAVEVDHTRRQFEEIAQRRQRIVGIETETVRAGRHRRVACGPGAPGRSASTEHSKRRRRPRFRRDSRATQRALVTDVRFALLVAIPVRELDGDETVALVEAARSRVALKRPKAQHTPRRCFG